MDPWDIYFASLCGWLLHPGYLRQDAVAPTLEYIANLADEMVEIRNGRMDSSGNRRL